jgi:hypothetical protein
MSLTLKAQEQTKNARKSFASGQGGPRTIARAFASGQGGPATIRQAGGCVARACTCGWGFPGRRDRRLGGRS